MIKELQTTNTDLGYNLQDGGYPLKLPKISEEVKFKISTTLKRQRGTDSYRKIMSNRMKAVWSDPDKRAALLCARAKKPTSGRPRISVFCEETGEVYNSLHSAGIATGTSFSCLSVRFKRSGDTIVVGGRSGKPKYTLHKIHVHSKESELLEASAGNAGGNQQPSTQLDSTPTV